MTDVRPFGGMAAHGAGTMNPHHLRTFLAVIEQGSFTQAARRVHVSQSTASLHIKELEDAVGAVLLDRSGRSVRPTAAGRVLASYGQRLILLGTEATQQVKALSTATSGQLEIAASTVPGEYLLPGHLRTFVDAYPSIQTMLRVSDTAGAIQDLLSGGADLAFVGSRPMEAGLITHVFTEDEIVLVGARKGPRPNDIPFRYVARPEGSGTQQAVANLLPKGATPALVVGGTEAMRRCVVQGVGLGFLSRQVMADDIAAGTVVVHPWPGTPLRRQIFVAWRAGGGLTTGARALLGSLGLAAHLLT